MIRDLHKKLKAREITSVALTEQYFAAIEAKDGEIGAYLTLMKDSALETAAAADAKFGAGEAMDLLTGIPGAVKDNILVDGESARVCVFDNRKSRVGKIIHKLDCRLGVDQVVVGHSFPMKLFP